MRHEPKFKTLVAEPCYTSAFWVYLYDSKKAMIEGYNDWCKEQGHLVERDTPDYKGVCVSYNVVQKAKVKVGNDEDEYDVFAVMFLNKDDVDLNTIAHECLHMVVSNERDVMKFIGLYGDRNGDGNDPEERIAYRLGSYFEDVVKFVFESGYTLRLNVDVESMKRIVVTKEPEEKPKKVIKKKPPKKDKKSDSKTR